MVVWICTLLFVSLNDFHVNILEDIRLQNSIQHHQTRRQCNKFMEYPHFWSKHYTRFIRASGRESNEEMLTNETGVYSCLLRMTISFKGSGYNWVGPRDDSYVTLHCGWRTSSTDQRFSQDASVSHVSSIQQQSTRWCVKIFGSSWFVNIKRP